MKKKIIVTGASGFVGFHIINYLISKKYSNVIGISRSRFSNKKNFITADLTSAECINIIKNCEVLINCAYDDSDYKNNFTITNNLINASQYKNIKTIIHISTAVVSGLKGRHDINENTPNNPDNLYQKTKLKIENKLKENLDSNIKLLILRPTMIIGKNSNNLDFIINKYKKKAIHNLIAFLVLKMRNTNFISINNITDIVYNMIKFPDNFKYTNYILSQDDDLNNNYGSVDKIIRQYYNMPERKYYFSLSRNILRIFFLLFRKNINPFKRFNSLNLNYNYVQDIKSAIIENLESIDK